MCVNDILAQGAEPLFFLDYFSCGKLDLNTTEAVVAGIAEACKKAGWALPFLGPLPQHMEVPRLGVQSEL